MNLLSLTISIFSFVFFKSVVECAKIRKEDVMKASEHFAHVLSDAKCSRPFPRVVKINDMISNYRKTFVPRCTLLYFCGEGTGCCPNESQQCVAKSSQPITKYFWVMEHTDRGIKKGVEWITFMNDTECHCQTINMTSTTATSSPPPTTITPVNEIDSSNNVTKVKTSLLGNETNLTSSSSLSSSAAKIPLTPSSLSSDHSSPSSSSASSLLSSSYNSVYRSRDSLRHLNSRLVRLSFESNGKFFTNLHPQHSTFTHWRKQA